MKHAKIAIVGGAGYVGSTTAYALMMRNLVSEIMLVDIDEKKCLGQVQDLADALTFSRTSSIYCARLQDAGQADIIIIAAGIAQKPGQKRAELLKINREVIISVVQSMQPIKKSAIIIMVTNPVDVLTMVAHEYASLPRHQIFGSGTFLDTHRLRACIGGILQVGQQSVHAYVLGEHGEKQFVAWSGANVGGVPLRQFKQLSPTFCEQMAAETRDRVYKIIEAKGATFFGVAACVSAYCENILFDLKRVVPLSCYIEKLGVCLSIPAVLGAHGVENILDVPLNADEQKLLHEAAASVRRDYQMK